MAGIIETQLKKAGPTFIYIFIPANYAVNSKIAAKRRKQIQLLKSICTGAKISYAYGVATVRDGIKQQFGKQPEAVLQEMLVKPNVNGIGEFFVIATAIISLITVLVGLLKTLGIIKSSSSVKDTAPGETDLDTSTGSNFLADNSDLLLIGGVGVAALLLMNKNKKDE